MIIAAVGEGWCFAIDALSCVAVIASLLAMHVEGRALPPRGGRMVDELRTGFQYVFRVVPVPFVGGGMMVTMAATNTMIQTIVTEELRGRVMAFYAMAFLGTAPVGSLVAGVVADRVGPALTVLGGGVACLIVTRWFALHLPRLRVLVRPIHVERGIIGAAEIEAGTKAP